MADRPPGTGAGAAPNDAGATLADIARAGEPDRYLAALLAPEPRRRALLALAAFSTELARIPFRAVQEPLMGEIRLEWWRGAIGLAASEVETGGQGVAAAVRAAAQAYDLPADLLHGLIDARALELQPSPFADDAALHDFLWRTEGALFALACRVVGLRPGPDVDEASAEAGRAYGLTRLLLRLPRSLVLGRVPLAQTRIAAAGLTQHEVLAGAGDARAAALLRACHAQIRDNLAAALRLTRALPRSARIAFLPLALVESYVRALEREGGGALRKEIQIVPLTRVWKIAVAHCCGRL